jgi:hypothetical protein
MVQFGFGKDLWDPETYLSSEVIEKERHPLSGKGMMTGCVEAHPIGPRSGGRR